MNSHPVRYLRSSTGTEQTHQGTMSSPFQKRNQYRIFKSINFIYTVTNLYGKLFALLRRRYPSRAIVPSINKLRELLRNHPKLQAQG